VKVITYTVNTNVCGVTSLLRNRCVYVRLRIHCGP